MAARPQLCAYCRQHAPVMEFLPFCSERCKMADLGQWLGGAYRVPGATDDTLDSQDDTRPDESDPELQENE